MSAASSTLRAQWLGQQLREMRESAKLTLQNIADYIHRNPSTVSRLESGIFPARVPEVLTYLDICGVDDPKRRADLKQMAQVVWQKGWWDGFSVDVAGTLIDWVWLESRAAEIYSFQVAVVPGLLQTRDYAETVIRTAEPEASEEQIDRFIELRMARQQRLTDDDPVEVRAVIDEAALRRPVGGADVMAAQLSRLISLGNRSNVTILVLPTSVGAHASPDGGFDVFRMRHPYPVAGCVGTAGGNLIVEDQAAEKLMRTYDRLCGMALPAQASLAFLSDLAKHWSD